MMETATRSAGKDLKEPPDTRMMEETGNGTITRYIRGLGIISSDSEEAKTYYHYVSDEQGSITHVLTEDAEILNHYSYDAFGNIIEKTEKVENRFCYNGEMLDPMTQQYYLRARFYNPVIGRFTQEDTYYGDGLNLYQYCQANPVGYVDPSGHSVCPVVQNHYDQYQEYRKQHPKANAADAYQSVTEKKSVKKDGSESGSKTGAGEYVAPSGGGGVTSTIKVNGRTVNFGHGGRHLEGTGLSVDTVNQALANEVSALNLGTGQFHKGQIIVDGITIEYTSYRVSEEIINVGTYYPLQ